MSGRVAGKTALVTGAARGLGAAISATLAEQGARVMLTDVDAAGAEAQASAIRALYGEQSALSCPLDVTSEAQWHDAVQRVRQDFGSLAILVNNAGIAPVGSIETIDYGVWKRAFDINVDGVFLGCRAALPLMRESQPASIVNISSISAMIAGPALVAYNASKAAVWMLTKSVALQSAKKGWDIRCNSVHPTFVKTDLLGEFQREGGPVSEDTLEQLAAQVPLGRIGTPQDVAMGVLYLASDESRYMTASELKLDGGISAQ